MTNSIVEGFLRDDATGALVTGTVGPLTIQGGFLRDANYALVTGATGAGAQVGFLRDAAYALVTVDYASAIPPLAVSRGFLRDANNAIVTTSTTAAAPPTSMRDGFLRDANYALVLLSTTSQLTLTPVASDNFNRANGSIAGANNWLATSDGTMAVSSNEAIGSAGAFTGNYRTDTYGSNQYSQCTVGSVALASGALIGVTARNQDAANGYAAVYFLNSGTSLHQLSIYKRVAGTWTELTSAANEYDPGTLAQGTLLTFVAEGSQLTFSAAGVDSVSITDTTFTGGTPGIAAFGTPTLDNWAGGNAATGSVGAAVASDSFNRANGGLSVGQANWGIMTGYPAVDIPIVTNQLNPTTGSHAADVRTDAFNADQWSAIQMGTTAMNSAGFVGVLSRVNAGLNSGYLGVNFQNGSYKIYRLDAGASTLLATAHTLGNDAAATPYMLVSQGSRHSFRVNGREVIAATDGTYASGQPGIMLFPISTADSWSGGNV